MKIDRPALPEPNEADLKNICRARNISPECFTDSQEIKLASPISLHAAWIYKNILSIPYPYQRDSSEIPRPVHGILHATRAAIFLVAIANLRRRHKDKDALALTPNDIHLLQIAVLFHDSARLNDGQDLWDKESAYLLYAYLVNVLNVSKEKALELAEAVAYKDQPNKNKAKYKKNEHKEEDEGDEERTEHTIINALPEKTTQKTIYQKLIHDADCLDIIRARYCFDANYLDFYHDIARNNEIAFNEMAQLIIEVRSLVELQGDAYDKNRANIQIKKSYECSGMMIYDKIMDNITRSKRLGVFRYQDAKQINPYYPILYYFSSALLSDDQLEHNVFNIAEQKEIRVLLDEGNVFARAIMEPCNIRLKTGESKSGRIPQEENLTALELRKVARRPGEPTRTNKPDRLSKHGNPNRSVSLLGWGAVPFHHVGFLIFRPAVENVLQCHAMDILSGIGKKKSEEIESERKSLSIEAKQAGLICISLDLI